MKRGGVLDRLSRPLLRAVGRSLQQVRRGLWFVTKPATLGAHAAAITPRGAIILVKLRYARGWRLPGGGRKPDEDPEAAALRELEEEIGMTSHGAVRLAAEICDDHDFCRDTSSLFLVEDVEYDPRWSLEVESVCECELDRLPPDTSPRTLRWLETLRPALPRPPVRRAGGSSRSRV